MIRLPSYRSMLQILLAILMMAGGAVDSLATAIGTAKLGNANPLERLPVSEEDDSELEKARRFEARHAVDRRRSDRHVNAAHSFVARDSFAARRHPVISLRPADIGRSPPALL